MVSLCLYLVGASASALDAKDDLVKAFKGYSNLSSFSCTVESQDSSGLYPGHYVLNLKWKKGNQFEIKVTEAQKPIPEPPQFTIPDFYCDGRKVTRVGDTRGLSPRELNKDPNVSPGYEVAVGPLMFFLLDSPTKKMLLDPPEGMTSTFAHGEKTKWKGKDAKEIIWSIRSGEDVIDASVFLSLNSKTVYGMEYEINDKEAFIHYKDQRLNPELSASLGKAPGR